MEDNKPIKNLKDILAQVEPGASSKTEQPAAATTPENISFVERAEIEAIFNQLQSSSSEKIIPQALIPLFINVDNNAGEAFYGKILAELVKQKKL